MKKDFASEWIRDYIKTKGLEPEQISKDLGIAEKRLCVECTESLWADEFLALCNYLNIDVDKLKKLG